MAAEAGSGEAQALLAFILSSGPEDMRDVDEADLWYERSAAAGCPQGMLGHALALNRKGGGETVQREVAVQLGKAAEAGLPAALYVLGVMSERGLGATRNEGAAAEFYRRAAEKGHRSGQARWGKALMYGFGVDANPSDGETWLRRAALAGDPEAAAAISMRPAETCRQIMRKQQVGSAAPPRPATRARRVRLACSILPVPASRTIPSRACSGSASPLLPGTGLRAPNSAISCSPASGKRTIVSSSTRGSSRRRHRVIWWLRTIVPSACLMVLAWYATTGRRHCGCAKPPTGSRTRNSGMAASWSRDEALTAMSRKGADGSRARLGSA
jgi:hypothetical protein